ncbi:MAG: putative AlkP superfamily phosphohydrolase/phosphomutase [Planctomycetota bacterium]|jgi:predicted AlkP superfamily phosphohydrolase/phosphomutase
MFLALSLACSDSPSKESNALEAEHAARAQVSTPEHPVLLVGLDGFEWNVILPLLHKGELPHLAKLVRAGHSGLLKTVVPTLSPRLWTTIATGKRPKAHGIIDFFHEAQEGEAPLAFTSEDRRTKALWNILGDYGLRSDTIGWWATFPAERVRGTMVAQTNTLGDKVRKGALKAGLSGQVYPPELEESVFARLREQEEDLDETMREIFGEFPSALDEVQAERWRACRWAFRADATYLQIAKDCIRRGPAALTAIYLGGTDVVGHRFWAAHDSTGYESVMDEAESEFFGEVVRDYYRFADSAIGELLQAYGGEVTTFVVADHGMTTLLQLDQKQQEASSWSELPLLTGDHALGNPGVFIAHGPGIRSNANSGKTDGGPSALGISGRIIDIAPTLLAFLGIPIGRDMNGSALSEVFAPEVLKIRPISFIETHDDEAWAASRTRTGAQPGGVEERYDQLRSLGYMGED